MRKLSKIKIKNKYAVCSRCKEVFIDDLLLYSSIICPNHINDGVQLILKRGLNKKDLEIYNNYIEKDKISINLFECKTILESKVKEFKTNNFPIPNIIIINESIFNILKEGSIINSSSSYYSSSYYRGTPICSIKGLKKKLIRIY